MKGLRIKLDGSEKLIAELRSRGQGLGGTSYLDILRAENSQLKIEISEYILNQDKADELLKEKDAKIEDLKEYKKQYPKHLFDRLREEIEKLS